MRPFLFVVFFASVILPAEARLGETEEQCVARYGSPEPSKPGVDNGNTLVFKKNGIEIDARFENGKCVDLSFSKEDGTDFTDDEISTLLSLNSQGLVWKVNPNPIQFSGSKTVAEWTRADGANASHWLSDPGFPTPFCFEICTKEYNDKMVAQNAADAKARAAQKLQGF